MTTTHRLIAALLMAGAIVPALPGQTAGRAQDEEAVVLSPFTVSAGNTGRYQSNEAASGSRVRISILNSTQNVAVVTRELIDDVGTGRLLDATKYVAGVSESTIPNAQDRTNIRGFQADGVTLDGFSYFSFANLDPSIVDRIEIVKGPNAVLSPQGVPGGTSNVVSKRPQWKDRGSVSLQVGQYNSNRGEFDVNRVYSSGKLAVRVVGALQKTDDYPGKNNFHRSNIVMPMFTYRVSPNTEVTFQLEAYDWRQLNYLGVPIDPYVGTNDQAVTVRGAPSDLVPYGDETIRFQKAIHARTFVTTNFSPNFSMRVATNFITATASSAQTNLGSPANNPDNLQNTNNAGYYTADGSWHPGRANGTAYVATRTYTRSGSPPGEQTRRQYDLQNDFVYKADVGPAKSVTTFGYWLTQSFVYDKGYAAAVKTPFSIDAYFDERTVVGALNNLNKNIGRTKQLYLNENVSLFSDRLIVNAGAAQAYYQVHNNNYMLNLQRYNDPHTFVPTYGLVAKPIPQVSLFYGFSKQSTAIGPNGSVIAANDSTLQRASLTTSRQNEVGARFQLLGDKLYFSVSHFDIKQNNYAIPNPANLVVPPPVPAFPALFMDRNSKGWEYELRATPTANLSVIGNYTNFKNRTPLDQVFRGSAEKSGAIWASYAFKVGPAKGLTIGAGLDYLDRRPGDNPAGPGLLKAGDNSTILVTVPQPTFWLPARTLLNASVAYVFSSHWRAQVNVDNVLNEDYLAASISRYGVWPGMGINARLTVRYDF